MVRMQQALSFLLVLLVFPSAMAEVPISPSCRVKNRPPGRCGWCALETLARHHGIQTLYHFTDSHPCDCSASSLEESLAQAGVHYRIQYPGCSSQKLLRDAIRWGLGAAVGVHEGPDSAEGHVVTLIEITASEVRYIDPNDADGRTHRVPLEQFLSSWDGLVVVLIPEV